MNTRALDVAEVTNLEGLEEELVTEESPVRILPTWPIFQADKQRQCAGFCLNSVQRESAVVRQ